MKHIPSDEIAALAKQAQLEVDDYSWGFSFSQAQLERFVALIEHRQEEQLRGGERALPIGEI